MRRWFRRKEKKQEEATENEAVLPEIEPEPSVEGEIEPDTTQEPESDQAPPAAAEVAPETCPETTPEPADASPEIPAADAEPASRPGFFRRWRRGREQTETEPVTEEAEVTADLGPETAPPAPPPPPTPGEAVADAGPAPVGAGFPRPSLELPEEEVPPAALKAPEATEILAVAAEAAPEEAEPPEPKKGLFRRFRERLNRTRDALAGGLDRLFAGRQVDAALLEELEELLVTADLGVETTLDLVQGLQEKLKRRELGDVARLKAALREAMVQLLQVPAAPEVAAHPRVALLVGVNGVGKTTTIAKLAHLERQAGRQPLLIAADTFRAAAVEQLEVWGQRVGAPVIKQKHGADPAAVVFDGLTAALARGVDTVFIDTAGRLHTKVNLMEELKKIHRTADKKMPGAPHEVLLVLDATTGQNALSQARLFHEAVGVTGLIITKLDGTAKGGVALAVVHETGIPLRFIGVGEGLEDLRPFDPEAFVAAILD